MKKLESFFESLSEGRLLVVTNFLCDCQPQPCCARFFPYEIMEARAQAILNNKSEEYFAHLLDGVNQEARRLFSQTQKTSCHVKYLIHNREVCRPFFMATYEISHQRCNNIRRAIMGDESYKLQPHTLTSTKTLAKKTAICDAFWEDFFTSLCPSPTEGVYLWPGNLSRRIIYVLDFVDWFIRKNDKKTQFPESSDSQSHPVFEEVPIEVGGSCGLSSPRSTFHVRSEDLFDDVESDSDDNEYDMSIPEELLDSLPCFSLFCKCRHHSWFDKVKKRPKHRQARCTTCSKLQLHCLLRWRANLSIDNCRKTLALHNQETRLWRDLENKFHSVAKQYNTKILVLSYDDTSALALPKFSLREPKTLPKGGVKFVPWNISNHGMSENHYFYSLKHLIQKGGNRICTFLYYYLARLKQFDSLQKNCQKLILMADNFVENKCNLLLCFLSQIIYMKWFETIELLFGPVGHTHNGNDSVHNCHNNIAGDFNSVTLADFLSIFPQAWADDKARPQGVFVESLLDWEKYYAAHIREVSGLTKSRHQQDYVRAIKLEMGNCNYVEMFYKRSPSDEKWGGLNEQDGKFPSANGFVILTSYPTGAPKIQERKVFSGEEKLKLERYLCHRLVYEISENAGLSQGLDWLRSLGDTGKIPTRGLSKLKIVSKARNFGSVEDVGVGNRIIALPIIRSTNMTQSDMFRLHNTTQQFQEDPPPRDDEIVNSDLNVRIRNKKRPPSRRKEKMFKLRGQCPRKLSLDVVEQKDEVDKSDESEAPKEAADDWGCKMIDTCGGFAVVHASYPQGSGLSIARVWKINKHCHVSNVCQMSNVKF